jgi:hypothetical protein
MKPIHFSNHARKRMFMRGAVEEEIVEVIRTSKWKPALQDKQQCRKTFPFNKPSPVNQQLYAFKTVHVIFVEEHEQFVVVTTIVYYGNEENPE